MLNVNRGLISLITLYSVFSMAQVTGPQAVSGEYIVKFKKNRTGVSAGLKIVGKMGSSVSVKGVFAGTDMVHLKVGSDAAKNALLSNPDIEFIEPNYILSVNPTEVSQLGSAPESTDEYIQSGAGARVQVTDSWSIQKPYNQGTKTVVAVIDTGLDREHLLFKDSGGIWVNSAEAAGSPGVDDDGNGYVDDINGWNFVGGNGNLADDNDHGTHVAGIVIGVGQDVVAMPVRESKVQIMALKFLDANGSGSTASAINAIYYAVAKGAKVINNSWGGSAYSQSLHEAYSYAYEHGVIIASAAGNNGTNNETSAIYPANLDTPNNIAVAATEDQTDDKANFSNYGASKVHIGAPGVRILSSVPGTGCIAPGCYQMMSGTSMATPFVAGVAALMIREAPELSAYQIRSILVGSGDVVPSLSGKVAAGSRLNVFAAIGNAISQASNPTWSPAYDPDYKSSRSPASEPNGSASPAGCGLVKAMMDSGGSGSGGSPLGEAADIFLVLSMVLLPLFMAYSLRARVGKVSMADRRAYERFALAKQALLQMGDQLINITTDDISLGGLSFSGVSAGLTKGQIIDVKFDQDSNESVKAEVVWCSTKQVYGLKFLNTSDNLKYQIQSWTKGLVPSN